MRARRLGGGRDDAFRHGNAGRLEGDLGAGLVHRERGGQHARMRVRDLQGFEDALDAAVLAALAVERVEASVRPEFGQAGGEVAVTSTRATR